MRHRRRQSGRYPLGGSLIFWGFYESAELRLIRKHLPATLDVVELGGSLGVVAAHIGQRLEPGRQLISVEANPALIEALRTNITRSASGAVERVQRRDLLQP